MPIIFESSDFQESYSFLLSTNFLQSLKRAGKALSRVMLKLWRVRHVWSVPKQGVSLDQISGPHKGGMMAPLSCYKTAEEMEKIVRAVNHRSLALVYAAWWMKRKGDVPQWLLMNEGAGEH